MSARSFLPARTLALLALVACASCGPEQTLHRVGFRVLAGGAARDAAGPLRVRTRSGWDVTVTAAQVSLAAVYFRNAPPSGGTADPQGRAVAQVITPFTVDALDPGLVEVPGGGEGIDEPARSAEVRLLEATEGPIAEAAGPGRAVAFVAGTAERDGETVAFRGGLVFAMDGRSGFEWVRDHRVENVPAELTASDGGTLTVRVDAAGWFEAVAFDTLPPPEGAVRGFDERAATVQLREGVGASVGVYLFTFETRAP